MAPNALRRPAQLGVCSGGRNVDAEGDDADAENDGTENEPNGDQHDNRDAEDETMTLTLRA